MGLGAAEVTFVPDTEIKSSDVNNNFSNLNNAGTFTGNVVLHTGSISRISKFSATGTGTAQTLSHGLGATPDIIILQYAGNFGSAPANPAYWYNATSTQVTCVAQSGYFFAGYAIAF